VLAVIQQHQCPAGGKVVDDEIGQGSQARPAREGGLPNPYYRRQLLFDEGGL
jgi:hypothetical protein